MYVGSLIMMLGTPLALGSYWGLVVLIPGLLALGARIVDEEKMLRDDLAGYDEYTRRVRYRLVPGRGDTRCRRTHRRWCEMTPCHPAVRPTPPSTARRDRRGVPWRR